MLPCFFAAQHGSILSAMGRRPLCRPCVLNPAFSPHSGFPRRSGFEGFSPGLFAKRPPSPARQRDVSMPLRPPHGSAPCLCRLAARSAPPGTPAALLLQLPRVARTRLLPRRGVLLLPSSGTPAALLLQLPVRREHVCSCAAASCFCLPPARPPPGPWWRRTRILRPPRQNRTRRTLARFGFPPWVASVSRFLRPFRPLCLAAQPLRGSSVLPGFTTHGRPDLRWSGRAFVYFSSLHLLLFGNFAYRLSVHPSLRRRISSPTNRRGRYSPSRRLVDRSPYRSQSSSSLRLVLRMVGRPATSRALTR